MSERFYIDCEFDGHGGPLLSFGVVREDGLGLHLKTIERANDPWVAENVVPLLDDHDADVSATHVCLNDVGSVLRNFIGRVERPVIVADSPVDIGRFCQAISTGMDGGWASTGYPQMTFEVHNVDCYPTELVGAVQHNAWWDAMALRHKLTSGMEAPSGGETTKIGSTEGDSPTAEGGDAQGDKS